MGGSKGYLELLDEGNLSDPFSEGTVEGIMKKLRKKDFSVIAGFTERRMTQMEIRQLKYFAAVADTLNFSRAAETLFISQSALSKQIADLERELGMVLLQRDKRSVRLTPAGKVFLNEAKVILMRMDTIPILLKKY